MNAFNNIYFVTFNKQSIENNGILGALQNITKHKNPFLELMSIRWYYAAQKENDIIQTVSRIKDVEPNSIYFVSDHFFRYNNINDRYKCIDVELDEIKYKKSLIIPFMACGGMGRDTLNFDKNSFPIVGEYNFFWTPRFKNIEKYKINNYCNIKKINDINILTIPLGGMEDFTPPKKNLKPSILLDEPHQLTLKHIDDLNKQHVCSWFKALEICEILANRGYTISTFSRWKHKLVKDIYAKYSFLNIISCEEWINYIDMLSYYSENSLFFSFHQESHGFPIYENLQIGNGIITFSENFNPLIINQLKNGVSCSLNMSSKICADLIDEYYSNYYNSVENIKEDAYLHYSADTFGVRLINQLKRNKLISPKIKA